MERETTTTPPFTNRRGSVPKPGVLRCQGDTRLGKQCRATAERGFATCRCHRDQESAAKAIEMLRDQLAANSIKPCA